MRGGDELHELDLLGSAALLIDGGGALLEVDASAGASFSRLSAA
jgi:hypothetical protein